MAPGEVAACGWSGFEKHRELPKLVARKMPPEPEKRAATSLSSVVLTGRVGDPEAVVSGSQPKALRNRVWIDLHSMPGLKAGAQF
jgi:hypothetical protein